VVGLPSSCSAPADSPFHSLLAFQRMCDDCVIFDRKIERLKDLVLQLSDFDERLAARAVFEIAKLRKIKARLHTAVTGGD
jgi:hypothetical protein